MKNLTDEAGKKSEAKIRFHENLFKYIAVNVILNVIVMYFYKVFDCWHL